MSLRWIAGVALAGAIGCGEDSEVEAGKGTAAPSAELASKEEAKKGWRERVKEKLSKGAEKAGEVAEEAEALLGAEMKPWIVAQHGGVYPDPALHAYLEEIVLRMAHETDQADMAWELEILNSSDLNAFALPGGKVFVTRGLLAALDSEAQFAHVMGHEIGHVVHRHMFRELGVKALREVLVRASAVAERKVLKKKPSDPLFVTAALNVGSRLATLKYSRDQERESDERGVDYALAAGYDPREGRKTFEMFLRAKQAAGRDESLLAGLLASHPLDSERIARIDAYIGEKHPAIARGERSLVSSGKAWKGHQDRLRRAAPTYGKQRRAMEIVAKAAEDGSADGLSQALALLDEAVAELPDHAAIHFARGYGKHVAGKDPESDLDRAVSLDGSHFQARLLRGLVRLESGRHADAAEDLEAAADLHSVNPAPYFYLGQCREELGMRADAIAAYRKAAVLAPAESTLKEMAEERLSALR